MSEPYYADDLVTLYHGDALEHMQQMPDESVDIVVTSPPFNMGTTPGGNGRGMYAHATQKASRFGDGYSEAGDDSMDPLDYSALRAAELWEMWRIARLGVFWNHRPRVIHGALVDPLDAVTVHTDGVRAALPPVRQRIILARPTGIDVNVNHFCTRGEYLYLFAKPAFRLKDHAASGMGDVWPVSIVNGSDHPAPFDVSIPARCFMATDAESVLDPFCGSGTTLAEAKGHGLTAIGVERSERFCKMSAQRCGLMIAAPDSLFGGAA